MKESKYLELKNELVDIVHCAFNDWDDYNEECYESHISPMEEVEDFVADAVLHAGYRKVEWISVEERLPEITETVLIAYKEKWEWETEWTFDVDVGSLDITGREWNTYHDLYEGQELHITHWMPLPEPPKMKGGE